MKKQTKCFVLAVASALIGILLYDVLDGSNIGIWLGGIAILASMVFGVIGAFGCKSD